MIKFRQKYAVLRKNTQMASCGYPETSLHIGFPWNGRTDHNTKLVGIMYAGRSEDGSKDDVIFYGINVYWEPLMMQLPEPPGGTYWKICVNTYEEYEDGKDFSIQSEVNNRLVIQPRTAVVLVAETLEEKTE